ncbi:3-oxoacyl-ACP synthase, partial [Flavobacteriaceae bacterium]|nr:3-oxoacyl-ACP synthase [Flavobacteriaceae bacterium]
LLISLNEETKSSAGDKHETTRAMIQIEREKNSKRIKEIENLKKQLIIIKSVQSDNSKVSPGSIILTSTNNYFISISSEIFSNDTSKFYCVSINTPIAKAYLGKMIGDIVTFNNIDSKIEKII